MSNTELRTVLSRLSVLDRFPAIAVTVAVSGIGSGQAFAAVIGS